MSLVNLKQPCCYSHSSRCIHAHMSCCGSASPFLEHAGEPIQPDSCPFLRREHAHDATLQKRKPVDLWSLLKSPYGLMVVASVFVIVVMPLMKVEPEEYNEFKSQMKAGAEARRSGQQKQIAGR